jgi:hypothetical protein
VLAGQPLDGLREVVRAVMQGVLEAEMIDASGPPRASARGRFSTELFERYLARSRRS